VSSDAPDVELRIAIAMPPLDAHARARAADQDWELSLLDPLDPDERAMLIGLAHPQLSDAIADGAEEVRVGGATMNPRMHLAIHEVVAQQLIDGEPPEAIETARRLLALGRDPHEVLHMLGSTVSAHLWNVLHDQRPYNRAEHVAALAALPGSWDRQAARARSRPQRRARSSPRKRGH
jgi:hypothetical protein